MSEWSKELEPLTPNHLLTMKNKTLLPPPGNFVKEEVYVQKRWRKVQFLAEQFWSRWWKDYLLSVNTRQKWFRPKRNLKIGNIVIVQEVLRNKWPLGKIMPIGDFNRSTRFFSFCEDKAWILKKRDMTQILISSKYQCKEWSSCWKAWSKTSSNGNVWCAQWNYSGFNITSPFRIINNLVGV